MVQMSGEAIAHQAFLSAIYPDHQKRGKIPEVG